MSTYFKQPKSIELFVDENETTIENFSTNSDSAARHDGVLRTQAYSATNPLTCNSTQRPVIAANSLSDCAAKLIQKHAENPKEYLFGSYFDVRGNKICRYGTGKTSDKAQGCGKSLPNVGNWGDCNNSDIHCYNMILNPHGPPPPLMGSPPSRPPTKKTLLTKKTKKAPFKKNMSQVSDLLLDTNVIEPYNLETILNKQKTEDITSLLQTLIKGNNYLLYDINNNKRDIYNELNNHNKKLYQEIAKTFKKNMKSENIYDIQMRQKVSNILTVFLEKVLTKTNIRNTRIQNARGKETKKLENKKQLLERQTKYDIQDIHIKNTVLKYIRLILYILIAILIVFCVINYIKK